MEKIKIIIEEVISQEFEVEVSSRENAYKEIRQRYCEGDLVLENCNITEGNVMIFNEDGSESDWVNLHV